MRLGEVVLGLGLDGLQEKPAPAGPVAIARHGEQALVVRVAMGLEIGADIERRFPDVAVLPKEQGHQQAAQTAVAVQKGMQGLELGVQDGELHQPVGGVRVDVGLPRAHGFGKESGVDGHEPGLVDGAAGRSDPVGHAAVFAGGLSLAPDAGQQHAMRLADDPLGQRQVLQHLPGPPHGGAVVEHLVDVVEARGRSRFPSRLEPQNLAHRRLGALDARRENRLPGDQGRQQDARARHDGEHSVVAGHRCRGRADERDQPCPVEVLGGKSTDVVLHGLHRTPPGLGVFGRRPAPRAPDVSRPFPGPIMPSRRPECHLIAKVSDKRRCAPRMAVKASSFLP